MATLRRAPKFLLLIWRWMQRLEDRARALLAEETPFLLDPANFQFNIIPQARKNAATPDAWRRRCVVSARNPVRMRERLLALGPDRGIFVRAPKGGALQLLGLSKKGGRVNRNNGIPQSITSC